MLHAYVHRFDLSPSLPSDGSIHPAAPPSPFPYLNPMSATSPTQPTHSISLTPFHPSSSLSPSHFVSPIRLSYTSHIHPQTPI